MIDAYMQQLSPYVRIAMDSWLNKVWLADRELWDYELLYVKEGILEITLKDEAFEATAGEVLLFKPRQRHGIRVIGDAPVNQPHIHFDLIELADSPLVPVSFKLATAMREEEVAWFRPDRLSGPDLILPTRMKPRAILRFEELLFRVIREFELQLPFYQLRLKGFMLDLLVFLLRDSFSPFQPAEQDKSKLLWDIQNYIHIHSNRELTLDEADGSFPSEQAVSHPNVQEHPQHRAYPLSPAAAIGTRQKPAEAYAAVYTRNLRCAGLFQHPRVQPRLQEQRRLQPDNVPERSLLTRQHLNSLNLFFNPLLRRS